MWDNSFQGLSVRPELLFFCVELEDDENGAEEEEDDEDANPEDVDDEDEDDEGENENAL